jgi:hypothetical protein
MCFLIVTICTCCTSLALSICIIVVKTVDYIYVWLTMNTWRRCICITRFYFIKLCPYKSTSSFLPKRKNTSSWLDFVLCPIPRWIVPIVLLFVPLQVALFIKSWLVDKAPCLCLLLENCLFQMKKKLKPNI